MLPLYETERQPPPDVYTQERELRIARSELASIVHGTNNALLAIRLNAGTLGRNDVDLRAVSSEIIAAVREISLSMDRLVSSSLALDTASLAQCFGRRNLASSPGRTPGTRIQQSKCSSDCLPLEKPHGL